MGSGTAKIRRRGARAVDRSGRASLLPVARSLLSVACPPGKARAGVPAAGCLMPPAASRRSGFMCLSRRPLHGD